MFGPHIDRVYAKKRGGHRPSITEHIKIAREKADGFDIKAVQMFIAGPRNMSMNMLPEEADELCAYLNDTGIVGVAHGTYLDFPWSGNAYVPKFIDTELKMCARAGLEGLVIHLGKQPIEQVMEYIPALVDSDSPAKIYLETPHVKPENSFYETPSKLSDLLEAVKKYDPHLNKFNICIDTAHIWSSGIDIQSFEDASAYIRDLEDMHDSKKIMFHLNDSFDARGSGLDHHAPLLQGKIWEEYSDDPFNSGLAAFLIYASQFDIMSILERKPPDALLDDYAVIQKIIPNA